MVFPTPVPYLPTSQSMHTVSELAPFVLLQRPTEHAIHAVSEVSPTIELYLPCAQSWQVPAVPYLPAAQEAPPDWQSDAESEPTALVVPAAQFLQSDSCPIPF